MMGQSDIYPKYPIFIPSKSRWEYRWTMKAFDKIGMKYTVVVEPQEYDNYAEYIPEEQLLRLPHQDKGLVVTRNWIWDYAQEQGYRRFWTFDDNIETFWRFHNNSKVKVFSPNFLAAIEDFTERYENIAISGMHYYMFIASRRNTSNEGRPFTTNSRIYSNMLIKTDIPYRNRGFYNDDTDLCLQVLNDGWCTVLFNAFLIKKRVTMSQPGGMTPHYLGDGRYKMAKELTERWPQYVKITRKWGRWQHQVDYRPFKKNKLIKRKDIEIPEGVNNYGMKLVRVD